MKIKKNLRRKIKSFCPQNQVKTKKKRSSSQFGTIMCKNLWGLFVLTGLFSSDKISMGGRQISMGDANFRYWDASPRISLTVKVLLYGLPIGSFPTFKGPSLAKTPLKCLVSCLLTFQQCHFKLPIGPRSCWYP